MVLMVLYYKYRKVRGVVSLLLVLTFGVEAVDDIFRPELRSHHPVISQPTAR